MRKTRGGWGETFFSPPPPPFPSRARLIFALLVLIRPHSILSESLAQATSERTLSNSTHCPFRWDCVHSFPGVTASLNRVQYRTGNFSYVASGYFRLAFSLLIHHFTSFLNHLSFSSSKNSKRNNKTKVLYCTDVFIWHQAIHSTYKMTPTYVRYMLQVFLGLFFSFLYKIPRYIMQGITSRVC